MAARCADTYNADERWTAQAAPLGRVNTETGIMATEVVDGVLVTFVNDSDAKTAQSAATVANHATRATEALVLRSQYEHGLGSTGAPDGEALGYARNTVPFDQTPFGLAAVPHGTRVSDATTRTLKAKSTQRSRVHDRWFNRGPAHVTVAGTGAGLPRKVK
jgi:hypothetical protein